MIDGWLSIDGHMIVMILRNTLVNYGKVCVFEMSENECIHEASCIFSQHVMSYNMLTAQEEQLQHKTLFNK